MNAMVASVTLSDEPESVEACWKCCMTLSFLEDYAEHRARVERIPTSIAEMARIQGQADLARIIAAEIRGLWR